VSRPPFLHRLLVGCYPPRWRERYADELLQVLADRRSGWRDLPNLAGGVVDAWANRRAWPAAGATAGHAPLMAAVPAPAATVASVPSVMAATPAVPPIGVIATTPPAGEMSRRRFLRRMLGVGTGLVLLEFGVGTLSFLWPQIREGLGAKFRVGTIDTVLAAEPGFANGHPFAYGPARVFLVNVPAAKELAMGNHVDLPNPAAAELLALWRKCPHLGCTVPYRDGFTFADPLNGETYSGWFRCPCHGSTYSDSGRRVFGPAPRSMDAFALIVGDDGTLTVDLITVYTSIAGNGDKATPTQA
jgi:cytochrome b6-f complex iron-sulfur subunit